MIIQRKFQNIRFGSEFWNEKFSLWPKIWSDPAYKFQNIWLNVIYYNSGGFSTTHSPCRKVLAELWHTIIGREFTGIVIP